MFAHTQTHARARTHTHARTRTHAHAYTRTHPHTRMHTHTFPAATPSSKLARGPVVSTRSELLVAHEKLGQLLLLLLLTVYVVPV